MGSSTSPVGIGKTCYVPAGQAFYLSPCERQPRSDIMRRPHASSIPFVSILLLAATMVAVGAAPATRAPRAKRPPGMTRIEADTLLQSYAKDRIETQKWLKSSPTSYLATVLRQDF